MTLPQVRAQLKKLGLPYSDVETVGAGVTRLVENALTIM